jgi:hypothetical protein
MGPLPVFCSNRSKNGERKSASTPSISKPTIMQLTLRKNSKSVNGSGYGASGATVDKGRDFDIDILSGVNASRRYLNFSVEF